MLNRNPAAISGESEFDPLAHVAASFNMPGPPAKSSIRRAAVPVRAGVSQLSVVIVMRTAWARSSRAAASLAGSCDASGSFARKTRSNSATVNGLSSLPAAAAGRRAVPNRGASVSSRTSYGSSTASVPEATATNESVGVRSVALLGGCMYTLS